MNAATKPATFARSGAQRACAGDRSVLFLCEDRGSSSQQAAAVHGMHWSTPDTRRSVLPGGGKRARPTRSASLISRIGVWQVTYEKQCVHPLTSDPCFLLWSVIEGVSCAGEVAFTPDLVLDRICDLSKFKAY
jgi:hypothetical protein